MSHKHSSVLLSTNASIHFNKAEAESTINDDKNDVTEFTKEFRKNQIHINDVQRLILSTGSSIASLINPHR